MSAMVTELIEMYRFNKLMVKMQTGKSNDANRARRIPSLLRGSVEVCVASEDILIVIVSCINPNVRP